MLLDTPDDGQAHYQLLVSDMMDYERSYGFHLIPDWEKVMTSNEFVTLSESNSYSTGMIH